MELVNEVLPIKVDGRIAVCEGVGSKAGSRKLYASLHNLIVVFFLLLLLYS
jgi:hypothetical protein